MKRIFTSFFFLLTTIGLFFPASSQAQCVVNASNNDYSVSVQITSLELLVPTNCEFGYNYNLAIGYEITYSGSNIPATMYNLQGEIGCGSQNLGFQFPTSTGSGNGVKVVSGTATTWSNPWRNVADCSTATAESLGCGLFTLRIEGVGIPSQTIECDAFRLPIELVHFSARPQGSEAVVLSWQTAAEENNDFFTIERSQNGQSWTALSTLAGAGNSQQLLDYKWTDLSPLPATSYYRLRQTDFDGTTTLSEVVTIRREATSPAIEVKLFPNPATDYAIIDASANLLNQARLLNLLGQDVGQQVNIQRQGETRLQINLHQLARGSYILQMGHKAVLLEKL